jgi:hypothetical protein
MVRCIVRNVCTCCSCRLAISLRVPFVAVHGTSRAAEALRVMLKCERASSRGSSACHASILPAPTTKFTRKEIVFAGNQQRLKKGSRLGIHESAWVTSNKRVTSSATIKMCLNLPAERRKGKERGCQTYDTGLSMRRQTVYVETNGDVPVAHGFGTTVLRRLSSHSLERQHWQYTNSFILQAVCSRRLGFQPCEPPMT